MHHSSSGPKEKDKIELEADRSFFSEEVSATPLKERRWYTQMSSIE
jgi:hypothetical protein